MSHVRSETRNGRRRDADLRKRAAEAGLDVETYARRKAAKMAVKAELRAAKAAAAIRRPLPPDSPKMAVSAAAEAPQVAPEGPWLIDGVLRRSSLTLMDGPDPTSVLTLALDLSIALAAGLPAWAGRAIQAPRLKVLILDLAFTTDVGARIRATELMRRVDTGDRLRISRGNLLIGSKTARSSFVNGIVEVGAPAVIIVNHLARLCETSALNPEDQADMSTLFDGLMGIGARLAGPAIIVLGGGDSRLASAANRVLYAQRDGQNVSMTAAGMTTLSFRLAQTRGVTIPISITDNKGSQNASYKI